MDDLKPALPPIISNNVASLARFALVSAATYLVSHGIIAQDQTTTFISVGSGLAMAAASTAWVWWQNRQGAKKLVAAAATGNPTADPKAPEVVQAISAAIADPNSSITAKDTTHA